jgi:catechol 2,3-dioxygenase-like lactoylglutathione lyase family enzyme
MAEAISSRVVVQVGLVVRDIEASRRAYATLFGVEPPPVHLTDPPEKTNARYRGSPTGARAKLAFLKMGQLSIELIEPVDGPSTWREFLESRGEGVHHLAFHVADTEREERLLEAAGFPVVQKGDYTGGRYSYVATEPGLGVALEFLQDLPVKP